MNPFGSVTTRARERTLSPGLDADYFASTEFLRRSMFVGATALQDKVELTLLMLKRVSLDPREVENMRKELREGVVYCRFFGMPNPVPSYCLPLESAELKRVFEAFESNLTSPMVSAAQRVLRWRTLENGVRRDMYFSNIQQRLQQVDGAPRSSLSDGSLQVDSMGKDVSARIKEHMKRVRSRRQRRLALLSQATSPGITSWYELVQDLAVSALCPTA